MLFLNHASDYLEMIVSLYKIISLFIPMSPATVRSQHMIGLCIVSKCSIPILKPCIPCTMILFPVLEWKCDSLLQLLSLLYVNILRALCWFVNQVMLDTVTLVVIGCQICIILFLTIKLSKIGIVFLFIFWYWYNSIDCLMLPLF